MKTQWRVMIHAFERAAAKVKAAPTADDRTMLSLANAKKMLKKAGTRLKRATTIEKKWRRRVKLLATRAEKAKLITAEARREALDKLAALRKARALRRQAAEAREKAAIKEVDGVKTFDFDLEAPL